MVSDDVESRYIFHFYRQMEGRISIRVRNVARGTTLQQVLHRFDVVEQDAQVKWRLKTDGVGCNEKCKRKKYDRKKNAK